MSVREKHVRLLDTIIRYLQDEILHVCRQWKVCQHDNKGYEWRFFCFLKPRGSFLPKRTISTITYLPVRGRSFSAVGSRHAERQRSTSERREETKRNWPLSERGGEGRERGTWNLEMGSLEVTFRCGELRTSRQSTRSLSGDTEKPSGSPPRIAHTCMRAFTYGVSTCFCSDPLEYYYRKPLKPDVVFSVRRQEVKPMCNVNRIL